MCRRLQENVDEGRDVVHYEHADSDASSSAHGTPNPDNTTDNGNDSGDGGSASPGAPVEQMAQMSVQQGRP